MPNVEYDTEELTKSIEEGAVGTPDSSFNSVTVNPLIAGSSAQEALLRHKIENREIQGGLTRNTEAPVWRQICYPIIWNIC